MITLKLQEFTESKMGRENDGGGRNWTSDALFRMGLLSMLTTGGRDSMLKEKEPMAS